MKLLADSPYCPDDEMREQMTETAVHGKFFRLMYVYEYPPRVNSDVDVSCLKSNISFQSSLLFIAFSWLLCNPDQINGPLYYRYHKYGTHTRRSINSDHKKKDRFTFVMGLEAKDMQG